MNGKWILWFSKNGDINVFTIEVKELISQSIFWWEYIHCFSTLWTWIANKSWQHWKLRSVFRGQQFLLSCFIDWMRINWREKFSFFFRKVTITGFDLKSYRQSLTKWNSAISAMKDQCDELGEDYCLKVYYEQLILHPRTWLTKILKFLNLEWTEDVMHHEKQINKPHGISLSKVERSSDQVFFL